MTSGTQLVYPPARARPWRRRTARRDAAVRPAGGILDGAILDGSARDGSARDGSLLDGSVGDRAIRRDGGTWRTRHRTSRGRALFPVSPAVGPTSLAEAGDGLAAVPLLPGEPTLPRRIQFLVVNACTVSSLLLGMTAVFLAIGGELRMASMALLACVALDGCDGAMARAFGVASPFGAQMDSLADLSAFGVATGIVAYLWLVEQGASPLSAATVGMLLAVCAAIRLARFHVSPKNSRYFRGLPTTAAAAVLALHMLVGPAMPAHLEVAVFAVCAVAMVTSFPYAKLAHVLRMPSWLWLLSGVGVLVNVPLTFAALVVAYLASGPFLWVHQHR